MTDSTPNSSKEAVPAQDWDELSELRRVLFGPELHERLEKAQLRAEDVSRVLPEAIIIQSSQPNAELTQAIVPTVEGAIQNSVQKDVNVLADALFPVIGPATQKAVSAALKNLTQSLNQALEHSLSPQSFKWRLEARRTGKSLAEIVLLHSLLYRVEQVFLIHKKTGLVLQHLVAETVTAQDGDLISAMLTAIQSFVQDSFSVQKGDSLESLQFGELTLWIEQGPQAILAGVIRGNAPHELRSVFQKVIERIHIDYRSALNSFRGDNAVFETSKQYLENCLQARYQQKEATPSPLLWGLIGSILLALGFWAFVSLQERQRWTTYLEKLNAQPGIVVTRAENRYGKYFISGLRDRLAVEPITLMKELDINPQKVNSRWEPYLSGYPGFIVTRAKQLLLPPKTVSLKSDKNGILYATGSAPYQWVNEAQKQARFIPGVTQFQAQNLIPIELKEFEVSKQQIEKQLLRFAEGSTQPEPGQNNTLENLAREIQRISNIASSIDKNVQIQILGRANKAGSQEANMLLSQARADAILSTLVSKGIKTNVKAMGIGTQKPLRDEYTGDDRKINRSVAFKMLLTDALNRKSTDR